MYRHFSYSLINILGLAVGLASAIVIGLWVHQESSYDEHFANADRIHRVGVSFANIGNMAPGPEQFNEVVTQFPSVELATTLSAEDPKTVSVGDREFKEVNIFYADSSFFDVFSYSFVEGRATTALDVPQTVVLTKETAIKYFSGRSALGEVIELGEDKKSYTVTGVVEKQGRSHIHADMFFHFEPEDETNWLSANYYNYVLLKDGTSTADFQEQLKVLVKNTIYPTLSKNQPYDEWIQSSDAYQFLPVPITDIYLKSSLRFDFSATGNEANVYIFSIISLFIVIIAGVNFVNITTARSSNRAKEVGIRKTLGTGRGSLVVQFLAESVVICAIALIFSFGLAEIFLAVFEQYTGVELLGSLFNEGSQLLIIACIAMLIGILAGLYPALYLSSFKPGPILKGETVSQQNTMFRNVLVIVQFTIVIGLLSCTGLVYQQMQFMQDKDKGLQTEDVLVINNSALIGDQKDSFKQQLLAQSGIVSASYNVRIPTGSSVWVKTFRTQEMEDGSPMQTFVGDADMVETLGFQLIEGRNFSSNISGDTAGVILNEAAVNRLMLKDPVGSVLNDDQKVIGIVTNFNFESLRKAVEPAAITLGETNRRMALKVSTSDVPGLIAQIEDAWESFNIAEPMEYYFLDQNYEALVADEKVLGRAILLFSILAIIISCLGLYGLSAYMAERRTKELGIRRVLGATASELIILLNKSLTKPILVSIVIAIPIAVIILNNWLNNFAYKTEMNPWIFAGAGITALLIAWLTVSWQSTRVAYANPVDSLRNE